MTWAQTTLSRLASLLDTCQHSHSVAVLDVDGLTAINTTAGRAEGTAVLARVEWRLAAAFADVLTERWVGDQFLIVLPFTSSDEAANRISPALTGSVGSTQYSLCAGGATSPQNGTTNLELMRNVTVALKYAKSLGSGQIVWSDVTLSPEREPPALEYGRFRDKPSMIGSLDGHASQTRVRDPRAAVDCGHIFGTVTSVARIGYARVSTRDQTPTIRSTR